LIAVALDGEVLTWPGSAERLFGVPTADALGKQLIDVSGIATPTADGTHEVHARHASGTKVPVIVAARKLDLGTWVVAVTDFEPAVDARMGKIAHDLRTPLNAILGFAELLQRGRAGKLAADQQDYVDEIVESARKLNEIIDAGLGQS
jgi:signal transduction histidine kinase